MSEEKKKSKERKLTKAYHDLDELGKRLLTTDEAVRDDLWEQIIILAYNTFKPSELLWYRAVKGKEVLNPQREFEIQELAFWEEVIPEAKKGFTPEKGKLSSFFRSRYEKRIIDYQRKSQYKEEIAVKSLDEPVGSNPDAPTLGSHIETPPMPLDAIPEDPIDLIDIRYLELSSLILKFIQSKPRQTERHYYHKLFYTFEVIFVIQKLRESSNINPYLKHTDEIWKSMKDMLVDFCVEGSCKRLDEIYDHSMKYYRELSTQLKKVTSDETFSGKSNPWERVALTYQLISEKKDKNNSTENGVEESKADLLSVPACTEPAQSTRTSDNTADNNTDSARKRKKYRSSFHERIKYNKGVLIDYLLYIDPVKQYKNRKAAESSYSQNLAYYRETQNLLRTTRFMEEG